MSALVNVEKAIGERVADALNGSVTGEPVQIGLHAKDAVCPGSRTGKRQRCRDRGLKEPPSRSSQSCILRMTQHFSQRPQRAAMTVIRAHIFNPLAVVTKKVPEPARIGMKGEP